MCEIVSMKKYLALSVVAPVGERILLGKKTLENRQWQPDELPLRNLLIVQNEVRLSSAGVSEDPCGEAVALVDIEEVVTWTEDGLVASCASYWEEGWLAWKVSNVRPVKCGHAVPAKLRIYQVEVDLEEAETII